MVVSLTDVCRGGSPRDNDAVSRPLRDLSVSAKRPFLPRLVPRAGRRLWGAQALLAASGWVAVRTAYPARHLRQAGSSDLLPTHSMGRHWGLLPGLSLPGES
jgi:hypothetical protein